ncbi:hypothetical protein V8F20_004480 [Naviculisporaceae sp. PSN 640]
MCMHIVLLSDHSLTFLWIILHTVPVCNPFSCKHSGQRVNVYYSISSIAHARLYFTYTAADQLVSMSTKLTEAGKENHKVILHMNMPMSIFLHSYL